MIEPTTPDEDEAFNELERISRIRQEAVKANFFESKFLKADFSFLEARFYAHEAQQRNNVIEEVAQHIEKLTGFGQDTISSFAIYIRGMKK
jgi:hypothetical protein